MPIQISIASGEKMLGYKEWRSIAVEYMRDYWHVEIKAAMEDWNVVDEDRLRAAHREGMPPKVFVSGLADECDWIDFGPWQ